jgi:potassium-dependent mechanosensitive channel
MRGRRTRRALCAGLFCVMFPCISVAQDEMPPSPTPGDMKLSVEAVQAKVKQIEEATDIDDAQRAKLLDLYKQTLDVLRGADEWTAKAAELDKARQEAPARLEEIRTELARPTPEPTPDVPPDASIQQLEQLLAQHEAELKALQTEATNLEEDRKLRADRRTKIPEETIAARQKLEEVNDELASAPPADEPGRLTEARRTFLAARKKALEAELATYEKEVQSYDARVELQTARRDRAARRIAQKEALVKAWREIVNERRRVETERARREAQRAARQEALLGRPVVKRIADENVKLAQSRAESRVVDKIEKTTLALEERSKLRSALEEDYKSIQERIRIAGLTKAMGLLLRKRLDSLPDARDYVQGSLRRQAELVDVQVEQLELEEKRSELANIESVVRAAMSELDTSVGEAERAEIETAIRENLENRRRLLDSLINDYRAYSERLIDLDTAESRLIRTITEFRRFIEEHILWVPSSSVSTITDIPRLLRSVYWIVSPDNWKDTLATLFASIRNRILLVVPATLLFAALLISRFWLSRRLTMLGDKAATSSMASMRPTLYAFLITLVLGLRWALVIWFVGWLLISHHDATEFARSVGAGLQVLAIFLAVGEWLRYVIRPKGLAESHFDLPEESVRLVRRYLFGSLALVLPLVFVLGLVEYYGDDDIWSTLGRLSFVVIHVVLAVFALRIHRAASAILRDAMHTQAGGWVDRLRYIWGPLMVGLPVLLIILALVGYYYTALQLAIRVQQTLWIVIGLTVLNAMLLRWVLVVRRKLAIEQYRKRRAAALAEAAKESGDGEPHEPAASETPQPEIDLTAIGAQTRALVRSLIGFGMIVGLWLVWVDVLPALNMLERVELWTTTQSVTELVALAPGTDAVTPTTLEKVVPVTLADVGMAGIILLVTVIALRNFPGLLEIVLLQRLPLQASARYAVTALARYIITVVGLIIAFGAIGVTWNKVQWLAAAITVGLGFGLQEIFANFVSGLIILFERPIRVGDIVTVGGLEGQVSRIQMRATTIVDWDRREMIVPNKTFITEQVINWTLSDPMTRVVFTVGIAYGSDTELAKHLLEKVAKDNPLVMSDPPPSALFMGFGDSTLNFVLRVFIATRSVWADVMHQMHTDIDQAFRKADIEIAFPQRDLHIRSIKEPLRVFGQGRHEEPLEKTVQRSEH